MVDLFKWGSNRKSKNVKLLHFIWPQRQMMADIWLAPPIYHSLIICSSVTSAFDGPPMCFFVCRYKHSTQTAHRPKQQMVATTLLWCCCQGNHCEDRGGSASCYLIVDNHSSFFVFFDGCMAGRESIPASYGWRQVPPWMSVLLIRGACGGLVLWGFSFKFVLKKTESESKCHLNTKVFHLCFSHFSLFPKDLSLLDLFQENQRTFPLPVLLCSGWFTSSDVIWFFCCESSAWPSLTLTPDPNTPSTRLL